MPRRREVPKREPQPDPIYNSGLVSFFINVVMKEGKKSTAEQLVYRAFDKIRDRTQEDPLKVFKKALPFFVYGLVGNDSMQLEKTERA